MRKLLLSVDPHRLDHSDVCEFINNNGPCDCGIDYQTLFFKAQAAIRILADVAERLVDNTSNDYAEWREPLRDAIAKARETVS